MWKVVLEMWQMCPITSLELRWSHSISFPFRLSVVLGKERRHLVSMEVWNDILLLEIHAKMKHRKQMHCHSAETNPTNYTFHPNEIPNMLTTSCVSFFWFWLQVPSLDAHIHLCCLLMMSWMFSTFNTGHKTFELVKTIQKSLFFLLSDLQKPLSTPWKFT